MINALRSLRRNWGNKAWWDTNVRAFLLEVTVGQYFKLVREPADSVLDLDWDFLILLDACRYDLAVESISGYEIGKRYSVGSSTEEFLTETFAGKELNDTVYVTANPQEAIHLDDPFYKTIRVWEEGWDDEYKTVLPSTMREATMHAARTYPDKRIIAHFMQPHFPFIGPLGRSIKAEGLDTLRNNIADVDNKRVVVGVWSQVRNGQLDVESVWPAYRENLELVFEEVERMLDQLDGRVVITSDHGNLVNERLSPFPIRMSGHPANLHVPELIEVPVITIESKGERRKIQRGKSSATTTEGDAAKEKLRHLGYID